MLSLVLFVLQVSFHSSNGLGLLYNDYYIVFTVKVSASRFEIILDQTFIIRRPKLESGLYKQEGGGQW